MNDKKYPIAEIFTSPQGEGLYTGTLMTFIRFAGCSVGKKLTKDERASWPAKLGVRVGDTLELQQLPIYTEQCCTYDGRTFLCDTDFRTKEVLTVPEICLRIPKDVKHVCLTGGEPLIHDLEPLIETLDGYNLVDKVHLETSGTIELPEYEQVSSDLLWITVSPKFGVLDSMLETADEIKILVDENFDESKLPEDIRNGTIPVVWIQPINHEFAVDDKNMQRVLELQKKHPTWRLSTQMHKIWRVR